MDLSSCLFPMYSCLLFSKNESGLSINLKAQTHHQSWFATSVPRMRPQYDLTDQVFPLIPSMVACFCLGRGLLMGSLISSLRLELCLELYPLSHGAKSQCSTLQLPPLDSILSQGGHSSESPCCDLPLCVPDLSGVRPDQSS